MQNTMVVGEGWMAAEEKNKKWIGERKKALKWIFLGYKLQQLYSPGKKISNVGGGIIEIPIFTPEFSSFFLSLS